MKEENKKWRKEISKAPEDESNVSCCIKEIHATPHDANGVAASQITLNGQVIQIFKAGQLRMQFKLEVGRKVDVAKISVIQYIKGATKTHNGVLKTITYPSPNKNWDWKEGADGYRVDMNRNNRCWPEFSENPVGLIRNENTKIITWYDEPGLDLVFIKNQLGYGKMKESDFPVELKSSFKTDIICSEPKPCGSENPRNRRRFHSKWNNKVVASVTWKVNVKIHAYDMGAWIITSHADNKPKITDISKKNNKECQGAM